VTLKFDPGDAEALRLLYPGTVTAAPYLTRGSLASRCGAGTSLLPPAGNLSDARSPDYPGGGRTKTFVRR
jgi:hypothetical protein